MRSRLLTTSALFAALALYPFIAGSYGLDLVTKVMIYAMFALGLELVVGTTGLVSLGHAAFFGIGAYAAVLASPQGEAGSALLLVVIAGLAAGAYALAVGALSLRTKGVYFIMVTLAFAQMAYYLAHDTPLGGGTDGIYLYVKPTVGALDLDKGGVMYGVTLVLLALVFAFLGILLRSRFGRALSGIKANEQRMRAAGFATYPYKLAAFVLSGMIAGVAGFLFAVKDGVVNPEILGWHLSGAVLIMIILGGLGHLRGAMVGAFAFALLQEFWKSESLFGAFSKHWQLGLGLTIIGCVALLPQGLVSLPSRFAARLTGRRAARDARASSIAEVTHEVD